MTPRAWLTFASVCLVWGIPYLLIKVAVEDGVPPAFLAWARVVLGAAVLIPIAWRSGTLRQLRGRLGWVAVFALTEIALPFPLIAAAEQVVTSSVTAILIAAAPLFVALLAIRFDPTERISRSRLVGLLVGLVGVAVLVGLDVAGRPLELVGAGAILLAALGYAVGPMILRLRLSDVDATATMGACLVMSSFMLLPLALYDVPHETPSVAAIGSVVVLGVVCTAAGLALYGALVLMVGAGRALLVTYVNPIVATALGVALLGERPGPGALVGLVLILLGSWLASRGSVEGAAHADPAVGHATGASGTSASSATDAPGA